VPSTLAPILSCRPVVATSMTIGALLSSTRPSASYRVGRLHQAVAFVLFTSNLFDEMCKGELRVHRRPSAATMTGCRSATLSIEPLVRHPSNVLPLCFGTQSTSILPQPARCYAETPVESAMPLSFPLGNRPLMLRPRRDPELHLALLATAARASTPL
jgi:hypothetical protein